MMKFQLMKKGIAGLLIVCLLTAAGQSRAQAPDSTTRIGAFIQKIQQAYQQAHYLGFNIRYYYANADKPNLFLDSLSGEIQMDKGRSRFALQGTETILNDKYSIQVNDDEKIIYLAAAHRATPGNPLGMLDSVFAHLGGIHITVRKEGGQDIMSLQFPPGKSYSRMEIRADGQTGFFQRISYWVNTATAAGKEMIDRPDNPTLYQAQGRMEIVFTGYQQGRFDDSVFREDKFFNKVAAGRFEPAGRYKDYHIFLASSNL